ncbi:UDP-4-amino-4,6-dideoxy-N-acetyl-beta-L-altrosamine transaminase [Rhodobacteraceae bacterium W635]|uniref:UDP-4-amino-4, 6-dideoxy-N-acetyl-beta-L-altrosamine transaminase n=1 Tax=Nioella halotolerans TaxID=2303578 RepID=UPI000E3DAB3E|nr:UDP-4-amino-4,6-dideoxy-N-acetyl-beta-L-altrosamine transaminase [Rhodobacteraceae bacterium W635]
MGGAGFIPYGRQDITEDDIDAVVAVLRSDFLTQGPKVPEFETAIAHATGSSHAVAVNSATSALHVACLALGLGPGGLVWTAPNTFVATANVARLCGADVDFVDIRASDYCMDPAALEAKLAAADRKPDILIPVHFAGQSADMKAIGAIAKAHGIRVIEDASHCIGADYNGRPVGACEFSDICVFSFHPVKIITTAEGGAATTQDAGLAARMGLFRSHGVTRDPALMETESAEPWEYDQVALGLNYRMTEMQAALGVTQAARLPEVVAHRQRMAERYHARLADLPLILPWQNPDGASALHLYPILIDTDKTDRTRRAVFDHLRANGIGVNVHYIPVHTQPDYRRLGFARGDFPVSEWYYARAISIPLYYGLDEDKQDRVVAALQAALA